MGSLGMTHEYNTKDMNDVAGVTKRQNRNVINSIEMTHEYNTNDMNNVTGVTESLTERAWI